MSRLWPSADIVFALTDVRFRVKRTSVTLFELAYQVTRAEVLFFRNPILGTADGEYWHCLGVRSFLLEMPQASMIAMRVFGHSVDCLDQLRIVFVAAPIDPP